MATNEYKSEASKAAALLGKARSERKAATSAANGRQGGRPTMEKRLEKLAYRIHGEVCGCDDKSCTKETEIYDWLYNGDNPAALRMADLADLVREWREWGGE